jgi:nitrogenase subunit NifH
MRENPLLSEEEKEVIAIGCDDVQQGTFFVLKSRVKLIIAATKQLYFVH